MSIERLNQGTPTPASQIPFHDPANGADRRASLDEVAEVLQSELAGSGGLITQYAAPNASGFTVIIAPPTDGVSVFLLLTPLAAYAAGAITLPAQATCVDGQEVLVHTTQAVTALTVNANGATAVNGAPTTLAQFAFFRLRYDGVSKSWYRVA